MALPTPTPTQAQDDEDVGLICQVAAGDAEAFEALYQRYAPRLIGYLQAQLYHLALAEEVCHDVLLAVWQQAGQFRRASRLSTWIYGIAWRQARRADARNRPPEVQHATWTDFWAQEVADPSVDFQYQERIQAVAQALATLPIHLRKPLTLQYDHDYTIRQIATEISCSEDTVKRRLRQARRRLAVTLKRSERARDRSVS